MGNVGEALYAVLRAKARASVAGRERPTWQDALDTLTSEYGSAAGIARELGLPPSTVRHWRAGRKPKNPDRLIRAALRVRRGG